MLRDLRLHGWSVVDDVDLELGEGLTVVTGETGTGKTTLLSAIALLAGGRGDSALVRTGDDRAAAEAVWSAVPASAVTVVEDAGGSVDDDELVVRRTVAAEGRSRAFAGGASVPAATLSALADALVAVHGQSDQQHLRRPAFQRDALDRFAGAEHLTLVSAYADVWRERLSVRAELDDVDAGRDRRRAAREQAADTIARIDAVAPVPGEDAALRQEADRLGNADTLGAAVAGALDRLRGGESSAAPTDAVTAVGDARRLIESALRDDSSLEPFAESLRAAGAVLDDVVVDLAAYADSLEVDPVRLETVQQRRAAIADLIRRYGGDDARLADVLEERERAQALLDAPDDDDLRSALQERLAAVDLEWERLRDAVNRGRVEAAERLADAVTAELQALAMPRARFVVEVRAAEPGPTGADEIELLLEPRADAPAVPLHRGASGGELSRVMLALEVVLAGTDPVGTFVFDEVDAGVGGRAAVDVGRRLARLARTSQVLVVTHLPQVAAFGDHHLVVRRDGDAVRARIDRLDDAGRVDELTRMLAGLEGSDAGRAHAEELLATARDLALDAPRPTRRRSAAKR